MPGSEMQRMVFVSYTILLLPLLLLLVGTATTTTTTTTTTATAAPSLGDGNVTANTATNEYPSDPLAGARALLERVFPAGASQIVMEIMPRKTQSSPSAMGLGATTDGKVLLRGTGGVELASALNWYLNDYLNITFDWNTYAQGQFPTEPKLRGLGDGVGSGFISNLGTLSSSARTVQKRHGDYERVMTPMLPLPLPASSGLERARRVPNSYYMNVCTYGYSLAFVPWSYWQKHIDWMAMNGINTPLAFVGQEWVWTKVFTALGLSAEEQETFYSGPAFLPWFRMGNVRGWGGPLTPEWMEARRALNVQILSRMRGLGMKPALPAFAGHVPAAFATRYPNASITRSPGWAGFTSTDPVTAPYAQVYLLDPSDPLFQRVGSLFITEQAKAYGTGT